MARDITAAVEAESQKPVVHPVLFAELDFSSGFVRAHSALGDLQVDGNTFTGLGELGTVSPVTEGSDLSANGITLGLSGVNLANVSIALGEDYQGRSAKLWVGFLDIDTLALIADPAGPWAYRMDVMEVTLGQSAVITLSAESRAALWGRANVRRYTNQDQQDVYAGDRFFEFVPEMADKEIIWPSAPSGAGSAAKRPSGSSTAVKQGRKGTGQNEAPAAGSVIDSTVGTDAQRGGNR